MKLKKVLVASSNPKKAKELQEILGKFNIEVLLPPEKLEVEEYGTTFVGNAYLKAKAYYEKYKIPTLADDSGLIVDAIAPYPGVYSARFYDLEIFGKVEPLPDIDAANIRKLLKVLKNEKKRRARFVSNIVLLIEEGKALMTEGMVEGKIIYTPKGNKGFGYDPIFVPEGYEKTFAEMEPEEKAKISHRGKALRKLVELLESFV
jgi:XTP/dITP diphosphohydrolase